MEKPNRKIYSSAVICQAILLTLSLVFLYLTIACYIEYMRNVDGYAIVQSNLNASAREGGLPNMPAGFAIATAISMFGLA